MKTKKQYEDQIKTITGHLKHGHSFTWGAFTMILYVLLFTIEPIHKHLADYAHRFGQFIYVVTPIVFYLIAVLISILTLHIIRAVARKRIRQLS